jgi:outer membrane biosynthesis protein TonB
MGLGEFLRQWAGSRIAVGVALSVLLHVLLVASLLWGLVPGLAPQWKTKPGDSLIVELPKPDEPAGVGVPSPAPPTPTPAPRTPASAAPAPAARVEPRPAPAREKAAPAPQEQRVASAPRPSPPTPPAPRVPDTPTSVPEPAPRAAEPTPPASEPTPRAGEPTPQASEPAPSEPARPAEAAPRREGGERQIASVPPSGSGRPSLSDVRAALRSGSGGLAGEGRGGIEGDPIPLDSPDGRYSDFLEQVKRRIMEKWGYPCVKNPQTRECEPHTTSLDVEFGIRKDGRIQYVEVLRVSDHAIYDDYAVNAIKLASPYPPVPPVMMKAMKAGSTGLALRARFNYVERASLTRFLH